MSLIYFLIVSERQCLLLQSTVFVAAQLSVYSVQQQLYLPIISTNIQQFYFCLCSVRSLCISSYSYICSFCKSTVMSVESIEQQLYLPVILMPRYIQKLYHFCFCCISSFSHISSFRKSTIARQFYRSTVRSI